LTIAPPITWFGLLSFAGLSTGSSAALQSRLAERWLCAPGWSIEGWRLAPRVISSAPQELSSRSWMLLPAGARPPRSLPLPAKAVSPRWWYIPAPAQEALGSPSSHQSFSTILDHNELLFSVNHIGSDHGRRQRVARSGLPPKMLWSDVGSFSRSTTLAVGG